MADQSVSQAALGRLARGASDRCRLLAGVQCHRLPALVEPPSLLHRPIGESLSTPSANSACKARFGSNSACRSMAIRSACPRCRIASACSGCGIRPTAMVLTSASCRTRSAKGTCNPRLRSMRAGLAAAAIPPDEQSTISTSSRHQPRFTYAVDYGRARACGYGHGRLHDRGADPGPPVRD